MQTSETGSGQSPFQKQRLASQAGMTLIEVLTVVFVVGLMSSIVVLTAPKEAPPERKFTDLLASSLEGAMDRAILSGVPVALRVTENAVYLEEWREAGWSRIDRSENKISGRFVAQMIEPIRGEDEKAGLVCDPTGWVSPAFFRVTGRKERWDIIVQESGEVLREER